MEMQKMRKIIKDIKESSLLFFVYLFRYGVFMKLPDSFILKLNYRARFRRKLNLSKPQYITEKMQWLKLNDRKPIYSIMADKYLAKEYIGNIIGNEYIIPLLGVWDCFDDINFNSLPDQFVLKTNHDCGGVWVCKNKNELDFTLLKKQITKRLKYNYYKRERMWSYKNIEPKILAEKYMEDEFEKELKDYKFLCFNGKVKLIQVFSKRGEGPTLANHYDTSWNRYYVNRANLKQNENEIAKPDKLNTMIELAETLSKNIPFVRVDLFYANGKIYFGEMTFHPGWSDAPTFGLEDDLKLGSWLDLGI